MSEKGMLEMLRVANEFSIECGLEFCNIDKKHDFLQLTAKKDPEPYFKSLEKYFRAIVSEEEYGYNVKFPADVWKGYLKEICIEIWIED